MRRPAVWAGFAAAGLMVGGAAPAEPGTLSVVAEKADGGAVVARPLTAGGSFALSYEHSAYRAPAVEMFAVTGRRFTMYAVASPNEAVLDYYAVDGRRSRVLGWWVLSPHSPQVFDELPLIATPVGRRTLVAESGCVPLYPRSGAYDLRIRIAPSRPAGRTRSCPPAVLQIVRGVPAGEAAEHS